MATATDTDTLASLVAELASWPGGTTVPVDGLAERLRPLIGSAPADRQQVAWILDLDGRHSGQALSPEQDG